MKGRIIAISSGIALGVGLLFSAQAQDTGKPISKELNAEADFISRATGEAHADVVRQLQLENDIGKQQISLKLREEFKDRLLGISIDHKQGSRLVVLLKGDEPVTNRILDINGNTLIVDFRVGYSHTKIELQKALDEKRIQ